MIIKKSKNIISVSPFARILIRGISLIILIFTSTENIYGNTGIKQFSFDLVSESVPNIVAFLALDRSVEKIYKLYDRLVPSISSNENILKKYLTPERKTFIFFHAFSKNIFLKHKENLIEIKLLSCKIGYRASYNYNIETRLIDVPNLSVRDFNLKKLTLTHDHVYDLLSISYGKNYKIKGSMYYRINIGLSINFPGEFYHTHMYFHPINLKEIRRYILDFNSNNVWSRNQFIVYNQFFQLDISIPARHPEYRDYYDIVFKSTSTSQWAINIILGLIENIFIEYSFVVPICRFLVFYPVYIHISIGTILGTIEWLYRYFKKNDKNGLLGYFYTLFCMQSVCILKIGYYE